VVLRANTADGVAGDENQTRDQVPQPEESSLARGAAGQIGRLVKTPEANAIVDGIAAAAESGGLEPYVRQFSLAGTVVLICMPSAEA